MGTVHVDMSGVENAIKVVNSNIGVIAQAVENVGTRVDYVAQEQADAKRKLEDLYAEFQEFVATDLRQKERQFATPGSSKSGKRWRRSSVIMP